MMNGLLFDLRDSLRGLRRSQLYAAAVVGTLALTLGATTAVFSIVNGVLLQPLAYREAERLVLIREVLPEVADQYPTLPVNARHFDQWRNRATSFAAIAELDWRTTNLTGAGEPAEIVMLRTSGTLFDVLQTPLVLGRPLTRDDERPDRPDVVVISQRLWRDRLGHDPAILGRNLMLGGTPYTIVGVLPSTYQLPTFDALSQSGSLTAKFDAIVPMRLNHHDVQGMLRAGDRGATDRGGLRTRATLLSVQVAISVTLLVMTGLFVTSFLHLLRIDPRFSSSRVIAVEIKPTASRYPDTKSRAALYDRVLDRVQALPDITSAAWTSMLPLTGETWVDLVARLDDTRPTAQKPNANYRFIGPDYFRTLSVPMLKGRSIKKRDRTNAVTPAVISGRAAETLWPGEDAVGRQFSRGDPDQHFEVVGVVADGHPTALDADAPLMVYVPYWFNNEGKSVMVVHAASDEGTVVSELRRVIREVDPEIAIASASPLERVVNQALEGRRYQMWLFVAFGLVAIVIATIGVYATTAYGVSRRRREMNIRVALGARVSQVFRLVLRQSATPVAVGLAAGAAGALALGTVVASLLFQVRASDPIVIASVLALVGTVGFLAAAAAARQGLRIDPAAALRDE